MDPVRAYFEYRAEFDAALRTVLESGSYILGEQVAAFERSFSAWCGVPAAIAVANGTDALHLALRTLGIGTGDLVLTVSHTAVATVAAIELAGAAPMLIDVDADTYTIDPQKLEDSIVATRRRPRHGVPKAVIAVHLYGHPADLGALRDICARHELHLIEDCAQAHGASEGGRRVGTGASAAAFSFYPTKNLPAFGDAGAVLFASKDLDDRGRALREYGWRRRFISDFPGMNTRLDELQAALLNVRLRHLDQEVARRQATAARYDAELDGELIVPVVRTGCEHAYHLYVVRTPHRDTLRENLQSRGIGTSIHYPMPVHRQPAYSGRVPHGEGGLQVTEDIAGQIVSLPMHPFLSSEEVSAVTEAVRMWSRARAAS